MLLVGEISDNRDICMNERMLERLSDSRVKFFHDRIHQQATLSLFQSVTLAFLCRHNFTLHFSRLVRTIFVAGHGCWGCWSGR